MFRIKLKELRENAKLSQAKFAKEIGVSQSTVGMWENGKNKPEYETLLNISKYFNVPLDYLVNNPISNKPEQHKLSEEEIELLEDFNLLDRLEKNIIIGYT